MTSCKVNFKVISRLPSKTAISTIYVAQILALYILSSYGCWHILISQCVLQKMTSCPSLVMSCPTFDVVHPRRDCKGKKGDTLSIGKKRFEKLQSSWCGSLWVWVYVGVGVVLCIWGSFFFFALALGKLSKQIFGKSWELGPTGLTPPPSPYVGIPKKEKKNMSILHFRLFWAYNLFMKKSHFFGDWWFLCGFNILFVDFLVGTGGPRHHLK